jgi:hypothetical protein
VRSFPAPANSVDQAKAIAMSMRCSEELRAQSIKGDALFRDSGIPPQITLVRNYYPEKFRARNKDAKRVSVPPQPLVRLLARLSN